jgi:hypothetical protein
MKFQLGLIVIGLAAAGLLIAQSLISTADALPGQPSTSIVAAQTTQQQTFGTLKGQVVFADDAIPEKKPLNVDKDQAQCLVNGPILDETWLVDGKTKGVANVLVFLVPPKGGELPANPNLPAPEKMASVDQPCCQFIPRLSVVRTGQTLRALNPMTIAHNVVIIGFKNQINYQIPAGKHVDIDLVPEVGRPLAVSCGAHAWMTGKMWMFDHPYYAVTNKNGEFEIKGVPSGTQNVAIWHEAIGYLGGAAGRAGTPREIKSGNDATDLGKIEIKP